MGGASISLWPEVRLREVGVWGYLRATAGAATSVMLAIVFATAPARAASAVAGERAPPASIVVSKPAIPPLPPFAYGAAAAVATGIVVAALRERLRSRERS
jgi:hypothetical protein